ncbi:protein-glutamate O-methyltransferase [Candidatus Chloroploca sp. M-50]|uniref:Protein-glutamate O-methyltransferase n=2 Tax=Candidatus Chloroploca mongolica TaxID=2528176 RepID=A0ABS4DF17_9CHLR|nr:protein-glutamate O-methyltransferase [Candidatus Chloroploca mongolica]
MYLALARNELLKQPDLVMLRDRIATAYGLYLDDTRTRTLEAAIQQRSSALGMSTERYTNQLTNQPDQQELQLLTEELLNHETQFFRNQPHMQALREVILRELHQRLPPGQPLRLWSAGCATGEEAYSLAITVLETFGEPLPRPIRIWATDLSSAALTRAKAGVYKGRSLANLTPQQRVRYFDAHGAELTVASRVRRLVQFDQFNLLDPIPAQGQGVDILFCQNVTIYFQINTCRSLMERFYHALNDGGFLFLGFSETLWNIFNKLRWREVGDSFVYYKDTAKIDEQRYRRTLALPTDPGPLSRGVPALAPACQPELSRATRRPSRPSQPHIDHRATSAIIEQIQGLLDTGQTEEALARLQSLPLIGSAAPQILALMARAHANRGDFELAGAEAHRALELNPLTTEAYCLIGLIYARQHRHSAALVQFERARYLDNQSPVLAFHLAECYRQLGRRDDALREYRNCIRQLTRHPPDKLLDGVAARWLSETCRRSMEGLRPERKYNL